MPGRPRPDELREVEVPSRPPRDPAAVLDAVDVRFLLRPWVCVKWLLLVPGATLVGLLLLVVVIALGRGVNPFEGAFFSMLYVGGGNLAAGLALRWWIRRRLAERRQLLLHGELVTGVVVRHGRTLGLTILLRRLDYVVRVRLTLPDGRSLPSSYRTPLRDFARRFPVGGEVQALWDPGTDRVLFPAAFGVRLTAAPEV